MRAGADPGVFVGAPIDQIVSAFGVLPSVVRHLISGKPGRGAKLLRRLHRAHAL